MTIKDYLTKYPELNTPYWWGRIKLQYTIVDENSTLTNYMVYMDKPYWWVEKFYDEAFILLGNEVDTTYHFMVEIDYDEELSKTLEEKLNNKFDNCENI